MNPMKATQPVVLTLSLVFCMTLSAAAWPPTPRFERTLNDDPGQLPQSVQAERLPSGLWSCTFRFKPGPDVGSVSLAGTFNNWSLAATPMQGPRGDGYWLVTTELPPGQHQYKFVVDGQRWLPDNENPVDADDGHGNRNSLLRLGQIAQLDVSDARRGDGAINADALTHDPSLPLYFQALAADRVLIRYRSLANDIEQAEVAVRNGPVEPMHVVQQDNLWTTWEANVSLPSSAVGRNASQFDYTFVVTDGDLRRAHPTDFTANYRHADIFQTPDWAKNAVWYQIMPDRFRNGRDDNDPPNAIPWTADWYALQPHERRRQEEEGQTFYNWIVFDRLYGGDFAGLEEKLPYLKDLGVTALYLNPVFIASSHHKYNATNYLHIDPAFGPPNDDYDAIVATEDLKDPNTWKWTKADKRFLAFLKASKQHGIRVIIDGVWNHVGDNHPAFLDVRDKRRASRYADWFDVTSWDPFEYRGWGGFGALPQFAKSPTGLASQSAKDHVFNVTRRWMDPDGDGDPSDGVDGWRLDVPNEIPAPFWTEWRALVKSINPEAYIVAEIWDRGDQYLTGQHYDAVMNYMFAKAVIDWLFDKTTKITTSDFDAQLRELRLAYPREATYVLQNLMNSHDTDRLVSMIINPDRPYDDGNRIQDNGPNYDARKPPAEAYQLARLVALIQMTYVGAPMVYYGDEVGMWGADDPTCRKPMLWKDLQPYELPEQNFVMDEHRAHYKRVIALRNAHAALRTGDFQTLLTDDENDVWAFLRWNDDEQIIVVINGSQRPQSVTVQLPEAARGDAWRTAYGPDDAIQSEGTQLRVQVPAVDGVVSVRQ